MQNGNKGSSNKTPSVSSDQEDNKGVQQDGFRIGDHKASSRDFQRVAKNQELGLVVGLNPSETEKEMAGRAGAGKVETLPPPLEKKTATWKEWSLPYRVWLRTSKLKKRAVLGVEKGTPKERIKTLGEERTVIHC
jgi:hypothetical protein